MNNVSGVPFVDGLMKVGLSQGAALTFLIAGPITTIPAMVAVAKIVHRKIFWFYLLFGFCASMLCGYLYELALKVI